MIADSPNIAQVIVNLFRGDDGPFLAAVRGGARRCGCRPRRCPRVRERLPNYMRPAAYQLLDVLPTLPASGKVDRKGVAAAGNRRRKIVKQSISNASRDAAPQHLGRDAGTAKVSVL